MSRSSASSPVTKQLPSRNSKNSWNNSKALSPTTPRPSLTPSALFYSTSMLPFVHNKNMLDDYGQKWFHTLEQFETNRLFARSRNPELESIAAGPGIFNVFKRQVNV